MASFDTLTIEQQQSRLLELAESSLVHWGLQGKLKLLKQRENAVYELITDSGERFALRVHRAGYHSDKALHSEMLWVKALSEYGIGSPNAVPTKTGAFIATVKTDSVPGERQVDLLTWVEGQQLGSIEEGLEGSEQEIHSCYRTIGQVAAKMHNQAVAWSLPEGFERHSWDADGLVGEAPFWGNFWELKALTKDQLRLIQQAREVVKQDLLAFGRTTDTYSLIHADFVPENFLVDGENVQVIDFDDAGFGWHLFDIATALYFIQGDPNYPIARAAIIEGYREYRELSDEMIAKLPLFMTARSFTYLGWVHTREATDTAKELTPILVEMCCQLCESYLQSKG